MIDSYTKLQTQLVAYLNRSDLTAQIPEFIDLAGEAIGRLARKKTIRGTLTLDAGVVAIPATVAEFRAIVVQGKGPLEITDAERVLEISAARHDVPGVPRYAAVAGSDLILAPVPAESYTADYTAYEKLVPLSASQASNSVLAEAPSLYLYGALLEAEPYLEHDERMPVWQSKFDKAIADLNIARQREEFAAGKRRTRLPVQFGGRP